MRRAPRSSGDGGRAAPRTRVGCAIAAAFCAAAIACAGCGTVAAQAPVAQKDAAGVTARLSTSPAPAVAMKPLLLSVALSDTDGRPVSARSVTFDLSMPAMPMAPNRPNVSPAGDAVYEATTMLSMGGEWRLMVSVDRPGRPPVTIPLTFSAN